jgi:hydroxypyruvate isomerase
MHRRQFVGTCAAAVVGATAAHSVLPFALSEETRPAFGNATLPLSVMLWTVEPKLPFDGRIAKVAEAGYHAVELVNEYNGWGPPDFSRCRRQLRHMSIAVDACSGIDASLCDSAQRDMLLQQVRAKLPVLAELECARLILLTGDRVAHLSHEQMHANCVEALKRLADLTAPQKVEILLETIDPEENPNYFLTSVAEGLHIVREVNRPEVRLLYDFFHEQIAEGNLIAKLDKNIDLIGLVHIADVPGRHAPGTGEINYASIFRKLGQLGYSRYAAMEFLPVGDVVFELRAAREFAEKHYAEGRTSSSGAQRRGENHASA